MSPLEGLAWASELIDMVRQLVTASLDMLDATGSEGTPEELAVARERMHRALDRLRGEL